MSNVVPMPDKCPPWATPQAWALWQAIAVSHGYGPIRYDDFTDIDGRTRSLSIALGEAVAMYLGTEAPMGVLIGGYVPHAEACVPMLSRFGKVINTHDRIIVVPHELPADFEAKCHV